MPIANQVSCSVTTNCPLSLSGTPSLRNGRWAEPPITQVPAPVPPATTTTVQLFEASAHKGAATGVNGQAAYSGPDGTVFTLTFSDPFSGPNDCTLSASGTPGNYRYSSTFNQGTVCNFECTITYDGGQ